MTRGVKWGQAEPLTVKQLIRYGVRKRADDCWVYRNGGANPKVKDKPIARIMMEEKLGRPLRDWERVRRNCGNSCCVNPEHLELFK